MWNNVTHHDGWPSFGLRFSEGTDERVVLEKLIRASNDPQFINRFQVYTTDSYAGGMHLCRNPFRPEQSIIIVQGTSRKQHLCPHATIIP